MQQNTKSVRQGSLLPIENAKEDDLDDLRHVSLRLADECRPANKQLDPRVVVAQVLIAKLLPGSVHYPQLFCLPLRLMDCLENTHLSRAPN